MQNSPEKQISFLVPKQARVRADRLCEAIRRDRASWRTIEENRRNDIERKAKTAFEKDPTSRLTIDGDVFALLSFNIQNRQDLK